MAGTRRPSAQIDAAILQAARSGFAQRGYGATTMREIAELAGVYEPMIYRRFESKAELFRRAVLTPLSEVIASYLDAFDSPAAAGGASTEELVRAFVPPLYRILREERELVLALLSAGEFHDDEVHGLDGSLSATVRHIVNKLEGHVAREASARPLPDLDAPRALLISFGMMLGLGLLDGAVHAEGQVDLGGDALIEEMVKFTLYGVAGRPTSSTGQPTAGLTELFERVADAERRAVRAEVELEHLRRQLGSAAPSSSTAGGHDSGARARRGRSRVDGESNSAST
jgi:AcrR family transcriptional regulator